MKNNLISKININNVRKSSFHLIKDSLNSEIHSFTLNGRKAILKIYKSEDELRIKRETEVLKLLREKNFKNIPEILETNFDKKYIIMSFIKGKSPNYNKNFVERLAYYINNMQTYISHDDKKNLPFASEAALSINEHFEKLFLKINYVKKKLKFFDEGKGITKIIDNKILPWIDVYKNYLAKNYSNFCEKIDLEDMILSQSDIGLHNTFIYKNDLYTFDYEYAGIDDPSKTFCDLIIQPNMLFNNENFFSNLNALRKIEIFKDCYEKSLIILPLYRYKWYAIIINSFLKNKKSNESKSLLFLEKSKLYLKKTYNPINYIINKKNIINLKI